MRVEFSTKSKCLFGKNGTVQLGDRFCCENGLLSILERKEKGCLYREQNRTVASKLALSMTLWFKAIMKKIQ